MKLPFLSALLVLALMAGAARSTEEALPPGVYHRATGAKLVLPPRPALPEVFKPKQDPELEVRIVDRGGDRVEIYKGGTLLHEHLIHVGRTSKTKTEFKWSEGGEGAANCNVALRYGDQLDLYICYAIRGKVVTHSELVQFKYQDDFVHRDFSWDVLMNSRVIVRFGNSLDGIIDWDPGRWVAKVVPHY